MSSSEGSEESEAPEPPCLNFLTFCENYTTNEGGKCGLCRSLWTDSGVCEVLDADKCPLCLETKPLLQHGARCRHGLCAPCWQKLGQRDLFEPIRPGRPNVDESDLETWTQYVRAFPVGSLPTLMNYYDSVASFDFTAGQGVWHERLYYYLLYRIPKLPEGRPQVWSLEDEDYVESFLQETQTMFLQENPAFVEAFERKHDEWNEKRDSLQKTVDMCPVCRAVTPAVPQS